MCKTFTVAGAAALSLMAYTATAASLDLPKTGEANPVARALQPKPTPVNLNRSRKPGTFKPMRSQDQVRADGASSDKAEASERAYSSFKRSPVNYSGIIIGRYFAGELIGAGVKDPKGEEIGRVEDLLIGAGSEVRRAIVETGGFLGIGTRMIAVDIDRLTRIRGNNASLFSSMTKEQFDALPEYTESGGTWVRRSQVKNH